MSGLLRRVIMPAVVAGVLAVAFSGAYRDVAAFDQPWDSGHNTTGYPGNPGSNPPGGNNQGGGGDPVNIYKGNFLYNELDINIPAPGISLRLIRNYNSQDRYSGPFGYGWHFSPFLVLVEVVEGSQRRVLLKRGDGIRVQFIDNGDGTYDTVEAGWYYELVQTETGFTLKERDGNAHTFDAGGNLLSTADRNGNRLAYGYDGSGRISSITDAAGRRITLAYGANGKVSTVTDFTGRAHRYNYDAQGNLTGVTNPLNFTTTYEYDTERRLLSVVNHLGEVMITHTYNNLNAVVTQTYRNGIVNFTYNDGYTKVNNRRGFNSDIYFNENGNPTRIIDPLNESVYFHYGSNMVLTKISNSDGDTIYTYDNDGNIVTVTDPGGNTTAYTYEQTYGQITSVTDPLGNMTFFDYDGKGNLIKKTDSLSRETLFEYDSAGKLTKATSPDGIVTTFTRSAAGYLTGITDTIGAHTYTAAIEYDSVGNVITVNRPNGATLVNEYDALGRITKATDNGTSPARVMEYVYDPGGRMTKLVENTFEKVFEYTGGRLTRLSYPGGTHVDYAYTANDLFSSIAFALGTISYTYSATDRVTKVNTPDAAEIDFSYANDYLVQMTSGDLDLSFTYDANGRVKTLKDNTSGDSIGFSYDEAGNRVQMIRAQDRTTTYTYDGVHRLVSMTDPDGHTTIFPTPIQTRNTTILNEVVYAYNHNETNRLLNLVSRKDSGDSVASYSFEYPDTLHQMMTIPAGKRWSSRVGEDIRDKRGVIMMRTPFELLR